MEMGVEAHATVDSMREIGTQPGGGHQILLAGLFTAGATERRDLPRPVAMRERRIRRRPRR
jgi:hypothetical protein